MSEKFCLKWNDFYSNVSKSFSIFRNEEYLHDVTLVSDNHNKVAAHKLVLSACSEYFKDIFKNNQHSHPLLCLDGVSGEDLRNIMDYIYNGEVQIYQNDLDRFLAIAQRLKLQGLIGNSSEENEKIEGNYIGEIKEEEEAVKYNSLPEMETTPTEFKRTPKQKLDVPVKSLVSTDSAGDKNEINEKVMQYLESCSDGTYQCSLCRKTCGKRFDMIRHIETHIDGLVYTCPVCEKTFRSRNSLASHKYQIHK